MTDQPNVSAQPVGHPQRLDYFALAPQVAGKLFEVSSALKKGGLEKRLSVLVDLRVAQINGCAFCVDMHSKEAKIAGERELRLYALAAWRESNLFTQRERAALAFAEAVTRLGPEGVPDEVFAPLKDQFSDSEIAHLALAIAVINAWTRLGVTFRSTPGSLDKKLGLDRANLH